MCGPVGTGAQQVGQLWQIKWLPALVHADPFLDGTHHGGEGVDWSPLNADLIVAPVKWDAPFISGGGVGRRQRLSLPNRGQARGNSQQLTFPHADHVTTINEVILWGEHDYQPRFSPDGTKVAYVRSFRNLDRQDCPGSLH